MKLKNYPQAKTLIFDLGEVIVNLDVDKVIADFTQLTKLNRSDIIHLVSANEDFFAYETGRISSSTFVDKVNQTLQINLSEQEFAKIWNGMLKDIPVKKLQLLEDCCQHYHTMIMSNTNEMHEEAFDHMVSELFEGRQMSDYVDNAYYSHKLGLRKPNKEVFEYLIASHELIPEATVFFDDKLENIQAAKQTGIQAVLINQPEELYKHFYEA